MNVRQKALKILQEFRSQLDELDMSRQEYTKLQSYSRKVFEKMGALELEVEPVETTGGEKYFKVNAQALKEAKFDIDIKVVPSPRIDYCLDCDDYHGYDCPKDALKVPARLNELDKAFLAPKDVPLFKKINEIIDYLEKYE